MSSVSPVWLYECIIWSMNVISPVCFVFHSLMFYLGINTFSLSLSLSYHVLTLRCHILLRFNIKAEQNIPSSFSQYHGWWWPGDEMSQDIINHGIDPVLTEYSSNRSTRINMWCASRICKISLTQWGQVTHICVSNLTTIGSDNGLSPGRHQAIIWTNAGILLIWTLKNKFQWNCHQNSYISIQENALENVIREMATILSWPQCFMPFWVMSSSEKMLHNITEREIVKKTCLTL